MKVVDTYAYISALRSLTEEGYEVAVIIAGNSMNPFLVHQRDQIYFKKPDRPLRRGDMVFYQRCDGRYIMHRICKVEGNQYYIVGDAQTVIEGPILEDQIFGLITKVQRKGKWIYPNHLVWKFYEKIWVRTIPVRRHLMRVYSFVGRRFGKERVE